MGKSNDLNNFPKLCVLEDAKEVLSSKPNDTLIMERLMFKSKNSSSTTAVVLWNPPATPIFSTSSPRSQTATTVPTPQLTSPSSGANVEGTTSSSSVKRREGDEEQEPNGMDINYS